MLEVQFSGNFNTRDDAVIAIQLFLEKVKEGYLSAPLTEDEDDNSFTWVITGEELSPQERFEKAISDVVREWDSYKAQESRDAVNSPEDYLNRNFGESISRLYHEFEGNSSEAIAYLEDL